MSPHPPPAGRDAPDVVVHPPVLFAGLFLLGLGLHRLWPIRLDRDWPWPQHSLVAVEIALHALGVAAVIVGMVYAVVAVVQLLRARTGIPTFLPATTLVTVGIFRYTRNPIYSGGVAVYAGLALLLDNVWLVILLVPLVAVLRYGVIAREEAYLERKFGQPYRDYMARVRRRL